MSEPMADAQVAQALQLERDGKARESLDLLDAAARAGHAPAQHELGVRLLSGRSAPRRHADALQLLEASAARGFHDALLLLSVLAAAGFSGPPDWDKAIALLRRARGDARADGQLAVLEQIDLAVWSEAQPPDMKMQSPRIGVMLGFLPPAMCAWMIERARPMLTRAVVDDAMAGGKRASEARTNSGAHFDLLNSDVVLQAIKARIAAVLRLPTGQQEYANVLHYQVGQVFETHYDYLDPEIPGFAAQIARIGQRVATFLVYLNEDFEGGETDFPKLNWRFKGATGDALFFWNVNQAGMVEPYSAHAGRAPTRGEKWLLSQWTRSIPLPLI